MILVDGLAEVAALLLVPPVGVRVAELALLGRGVGVAAVLLLLVSERLVGNEREGGTDHAGVVDVGLGEGADLGESWGGGFVGSEEVGDWPRGGEGSEDHLRRVVRGNWGEYQYDS